MCRQLQLRCALTVLHTTLPRAAATRLSRVAEEALEDGRSTAEGHRAPRMDGPGGRWEGREAVPGMGAHRGGGLRGRQAGTVHGVSQQKSADAPRAPPPRRQGHHPLPGLPLAAGLASWCPPKTAGRPTGRQLLASPDRAGCSPQPTSFGCGRGGDGTPGAGQTVLYCTSVGGRWMWVRIGRVDPFPRARYILYLQSLP
nr:hypothetical protein CFP56_12328 [Quercus suber]